MGLERRPSMRKKVFTSLERTQMQLGFMSFFFFFSAAWRMFVEDISKG